MSTNPTTDGAIDATVTDLTPAADAPTMPALSLQELGLIVAGGNVMTDLVKQRVDEARAETLARFRALSAETGSTQIAVKVPGRTEKVATISLAQPKDKATVSNEVEFTAWVEDHFETEVEVVTVIKPAFLKRFLEKQVKLNIETGEVLYLNEDTGEATVIPGLKAVPGGEPTSISLRWNGDGKDAVADIVNGTTIAQLTAAPTARVVDVTAVADDAQGAA